MALAAVGLFAGKILPPGTAELSPSWAKYQEGVGQVEQGKLDEAERAFRESLERDPQQASAWLGLGEIALRRGDREMAREDFERALRIAPNAPGVLTAVGRLRAILKDNAGAESFFRKAISADPRAIAPYLDLGDLFALAYRKPEEALKWYRKAIEAQPENPIAHYRAGLTLGDLKRYPEAQSELFLAARKAPDNPLPYQELGRLYMAIGDYGKASDAFWNAERASPQYVGAYIGRGDALALKGDTNLALWEYQRATQVASGYAPAYLKLGMLYQAMNRAKDARKAYLKAIELDPNQAGAYNNLACLALDGKSDLDQALAWAQKAVAIQPGNLLFGDTLAWVQYLKGDRSRATAFYREAVAKNVRNSEVLYHAGVVLEASGEVPAARTALQEALRLQPSFAGADDARRRLAALGGPKTPAR